MAVRLRISVLHPVINDPLGRQFVGWFPGRSEVDLWHNHRGLWKINRAKLRHERFALIVYNDTVVAVGEIAAVIDHGDRVELEGPVLTPGHPVREAWIGRPDPAANNSRNPVGYVELLEEREYVERPCRCGCGESTTADFLPGHDVRAMQDRVRRIFGGSPLAFISWVDEMADRHGVTSHDAHGNPVTQHFPRPLLPDVPRDR